MGVFKAKELSSPKVSVRPAIMIIPSTYPFLLVPTSQDASQAASYLLIQAGKDSPAAMLEVLMPSSQGSVHPRDDAFQRLPVGSSHLLANGLFQFLQALLPRPSAPSLKMVSKEVGERYGVKSLFLTWFDSFLYPFNLCCQVLIFPLQCKRPLPHHTHRAIINTH